MVRAQSFATGGWGPNETLCAPGSGALGDSLTKTHSSFETPCGAYAMFKITRYLLRVTRDTRYGDTMERVLYNTILGAKPITKSGYGFYYSDYNDEGSKFYHHDKWTCCSGTFAQITADYGISAYFHDAQGCVYVNLYVPSRVSWQQRRELITLTQTTRYPFEPTTTLTVSVRKPTEIPIYLRIPEWSAFKTRITINGLKAVMESSTTACFCPPPGEFLCLKRTWKNGDRIEIEFDMPTTLEAVDLEHPSLVAPIHGPLALFTLSQIPPHLTSKMLLSIRQAARGSSDWQAQTEAGTLSLRPFQAIKDEPYRLYLPIES